MKRRCLQYMFIFFLLISSTSYGNDGIVEVAENTYFIQNASQGLEMITSPFEFKTWTKGTLNDAITLKLNQAAWGDGNICRFDQFKSTALTENSITYHYYNMDVEYLRTNSGIKQNIYLNYEPPIKKGIRITLDLNTAEKFILRDGVVIFYSEAEGVVHELFRYTGLLVYDHNGMQLPSHIAINGASIYLEIDDTEAEYPILIDPISTVYYWTKTGGQESDWFGSSVANAGDVYGDGYEDILIGSNRYTNGSNQEGIVYLFNVTPSGIPDTAEWKSEGDQIGAYYGICVAGAGDVNGDGYDDIFIGSNLFNDQAIDDGAAFIFFGSAAGPSEIPDWFAGGLEPGGYFGFSGGKAGDVNNDGYDDVFVGEGYGVYGLPELAGKVSVYLGSALGPSIAPDWDYVGTTNDLFGYSVACADINGDSYSDLMATSQNRGDLFAFYGSATGLSASPSFTFNGLAHLGAEVSVAGDVNGDGFKDILVSHPDKGRMFLLYGSSTGLSETNFTTFGGQGYGETGNDHSGVGDVNSDGYDDIVVCENKDLFLLYLGSEKGIITHPSWYVNLEDDMGVIGDAIDIASLGDIDHDGYDDFIIGSGYQEHTYFAEGAVYIYKGQSDIFNSREPDTRFIAGTTGDFYETTVTGTAAGDVNGDGYADILFGFENHDEPGKIDAGKVGLIYGKSTPLPSTLDWSVIGVETQQYMGASISKAGDVNNDGYDDVLVGSPYMNGVAILTGRVDLYLGSATGLGTSSAWSYEGSQYSELFGATMCGAGDVNGDGFDDVLISSPKFDGAQTDEGKVFLFYGNSSGLDMFPDWSFESNSSGASMGYGIGPAGDINNDGYSDIILGAELYFNSPSSQGKAWAFYGSATGLPATPNWTLTGTSSNLYLGEEVYTAGDVNNDGYDDVLIGDHAAYSGGLQKGRAYLFYGSALGFGATANWTVSGTDDGEGMGQTARGIGDINGDGFDDFFICELYDGYGIQSTGVGYIYYGKTGVPSPQVKQMLTVGRYQADFGAHVANCGDINNDGLIDFLVTVPGYYEEYNDGYYIYYEVGGFSGAVFLYYNQNSICSAPTGLIVTDITDVSAHLSWSSDSDDFTVRWKLTTDTTWNYTTTSDLSITFFTLLPCSNYEVQVLSTCFPSGDSEFSESFLFTTTGCVVPCDVAPTGIFSTVLSPTKAKLTWDVMDGAVKYKIMYRSVGAASWFSANATTNTKTIKGLTAGTSYEYKVRSVCAAVNSPWSPLYYFSTPLRLLEKNEMKVSVFPNPATNYFYVFIPVDNDNTISVQLIDTNGNFVYFENSVKVHDSLIQIHTDKLPAGMYYFKAITTTEEFTTSIIIQ